MVSINANIEFYDEENYLSLQHDIKVFDENTDEPQSIGHILTYIFDTEVLSKLDILSIVDEEIDGAVEAIYPFDIVDPMEHLDFILSGETCHPRPYVFGKIAVIGYLSIEKTHRRNKSGTEALQLLIRLLNKLSVDCIVVYPTPVASEDQTINLEGLNNFYEKNGFSLYKGSAFLYVEEAIAKMDGEHPLP